MELMAAVHKYFRELQLHAGYYRFMRSQESALHADERKAISALAEKLESADRPQRADDDLGAEQKMLRDLVLQACPFRSSFILSDLRDKFKNRNPYRRMPALAEKLQKATQKLHEAGILLQAAAPQAGDAQKAARGPRKTAQPYEVAAWSAISASPAVLQLCESLKLGRDAFA